MDSSIDVSYGEDKFEDTNARPAPPRGASSLGPAPPPPLSSYPPAPVSPRATVENAGPDGVTPMAGGAGPSNFRSVSFHGRNTTLNNNMNGANSFGATNSYALDGSMAESAPPSAPVPSSVPPLPLAGLTHPQQQPPPQPHHHHLQPPHQQLPPQPPLQQQQSYPQTPPRSATRPQSPAARPQSPARLLAPAPALPLPLPMPAPAPAHSSYNYNPVNNPITSSSSSGGNGLSPRSHYHAHSVAPTNGSGATGTVTGTDAPAPQHLRHVPLLPNSPRPAAYPAAPTEPRPANAVALPTTAQQLQHQQQHYGQYPQQQPQPQYQRPPQSQYGQSSYAPASSSSYYAPPPPSSSLSSSSSYMPALTSSYSSSLGGLGGVGSLPAGAPQQTPLSPRSALAPLYQSLQRQPPITAAAAAPSYYNSNPAPTITSSSISSSYFVPSAEPAAVDAMLRRPASPIPPLTSTLRPPPLASLAATTSFQPRLSGLPASAPHSGSGGSGSGGGGDVARLAEGLPMDSALRALLATGGPAPAGCSSGGGAQQVLSPAAAEAFTRLPAELRALLTPAAADAVYSSSYASLPAQSAFGARQGPVSSAVGAWGSLPFAATASAPSSGYNSNNIGGGSVGVGGATREDEISAALSALTQALANSAGDGKSGLHSSIGGYSNTNSASASASGPRTSGAALYSQPADARPLSPRSPQAQSLSAALAALLKQNPLGGPAPADSAVLSGYSGAIGPGLGGSGSFGGGNGSGNGSGVSAIAGDPFGQEFNLRPDPAVVAAWARWIKQYQANVASHGYHTRFSELSARTPLTVPHCPVTRFDALPALSSDFNAARAAFAASDVAADLPIWCPQCYPLTENEVKSFFSLPDRFRSLLALPWSAHPWEHIYRHFYPSAQFLPTLNCPGCAQPLNACTCAAACAHDDCGFYTCEQECYADVGGARARQRLGAALARHRDTGIVTNADLMAHRQRLEKERRARLPRCAREQRPSPAALLRLAAHAPCPPRCDAYPADATGAAALAAAAHVRARAHPALSCEHMPTAGSLPAHRLAAPHAAPEPGAAAAAAAGSRFATQIVAVPRGRGNVTVGVVLDSKPAPAAAVPYGAPPHAQAQPYTPAAAAAAAVAADAYVRAAARGAARPASAPAARAPQLQQQHPQGQWLQVAAAQTRAMAAGHGAAPKAFVGHHQSQQQRPQRWGWDDVPVTFPKQSQLQSQQQVKQVRFTSATASGRPAPWAPPQPLGVSVVPQSNSNPVHSHQAHRQQHQQQPRVMMAQRAYAPVPQALRPSQGGASALERTLPSGGVAQLMYQARG